jgi:hypothetical protein
MLKYERLKVLGAGAFGQAVLVRENAGDRRRLVIKEVAVRPDKLAEAQHEAAVMQKINHSNIVRYIDSFVEHPKFYIVMEHADGARRARWRRPGVGVAPRAPSAVSARRGHFASPLWRRRRPGAGGGAAAQGARHDRRIRVVALRPFGRRAMLTHRAHSAKVRAAPLPVLPRW